MSRGKKKALKQASHFLKIEVLDVLERGPKKGLSARDLLKRLGMLDVKEGRLLEKVLDQLRTGGKIRLQESGRYVLGLSGEVISGRIEINMQGNGYVVSPELESDVFIPYSKLNCSLNGDEVEVQILKRKKSGAPEGSVLRVLARKRVQFVGTLDQYSDFSFVKPRDVRVYKDLYIRNEDLMGAVGGDTVLAELVKWSDPGQSPNGKVISVLGKAGKHDTEIHSILAEYGLPSEFPYEVDKYANEIDTSITDLDVAERKDFRGKLTFTIDPRDAKDFDDALSVVDLGENTWEVGVHIADVSHYVKEGTVLDEEAINRATSVYLVDRVVPMLPEVLSNNACSLRPLEDKLTFSVVFKINNEGRVLEQWMGRTIIHSNYRFAYEEAQHIIEYPEAPIPEEVSLSGRAYLPNRDVVGAITTLNRIATVLRKGRMASGAISFDKIEVKFNLSPDNEPLGVYFKEAKEANKLIEEFMLLANRKVAEFIGKSKPKYTFVYRVHDSPDEDKLYALNGLIGRFGHSLNFKNTQALSASLNKLLEDVKGKREQNLVDTLAIRSMSKAIYTTQNIGHYGLAFEYYTHFTSPIRRYPDVMVHRLLFNYLNNKSSAKEEVIEVLCKQSTDREILASNAERDSIKFMQVRYMDAHRNTDFKGVISGVTEWGLYVEVIENKCEGMVRLRDLKGDFFTYNEKEYSVIGERSGKRYQLGDEVVVRVKATDVIKRHLDYELVERGTLKRSLSFK